MMPHAPGEDMPDLCRLQLRILQIRALRGETRLSLHAVLPYTFR